MEVRSGAFLLSLPLELLNYVLVLLPARDASICRRVCVRLSRAIRDARPTLLSRQMSYPPKLVRFSDNTDFSGKSCRVYSLYAQKWYILSRKSLQCLSFDGNEVFRHDLPRCPDKSSHIHLFSCSSSESRYVLIGCASKTQTQFRHALDTVTGELDGLPEDFPTCATTKNTNIFVCQRTVLWYEASREKICELPLNCARGETLFSRVLTDSPGGIPSLLHRHSHWLLKRIPAGIIEVDLTDDGCVTFSDYSTSNRTAQLKPAGAWLIRQHITSSHSTIQYSFFFMEWSRFVSHCRAPAKDSSLTAVFSDFFLIMHQHSKVGNSYLFASVEVISMWNGKTLLKWDFEIPGQITAPAADQTGALISPPIPAPPAPFPKADNPVSVTRISEFCFDGDNLLITTETRTAGGVGGTSVFHLSLQDQ